MRIFICFVCLVVSIQAKSSTYFSARKLVDSDPREADALLARVAADNADPKISRAALYDLFYLRLKHGRLAEAFAVARTKTMKKKLAEASAAHLGISDKSAERLIHVLRAACQGEVNAGKVSQLLVGKKAGAKVYDLALKALRGCHMNKVAEAVLAQREEGFSSRRLIQLHLMAIRYALEDGLDAEAESLVEMLRNGGGEIFMEDKELQGQFALIEARRASRAGDSEAARGHCAAMDAGKKLAVTRRSCRFVLAFALAAEGKFVAGYALVSTEEIENHELDLRLLRLSLKVGAQKAPVEKLRAFQKRASYASTAKSLQELANNVAITNK